MENVSARFSNVLAFRSMYGRMFTELKLVEIPNRCRCPKRNTKRFRYLKKNPTSCIYIFTEFIEWGGASRIVCRVDCIVLHIVASCRKNVNACVISRPFIRPNTRLSNDTTAGICLLVSNPIRVSSFSIS